MAIKKVGYIWAKQVLAPECETIDCPVYDPIKDFRRDPTGFYVLIRLDFDHQMIEVAICDKKHRIVMIFRGKSAVDVYEGIMRYERRHRKLWFADKAHAAYLGKELKKADLAITLPTHDYIQE